MLFNGRKPKRYLKIATYYHTHIMEPYGIKTNGRHSTDMKCIAWDEEDRPYLWGFDNSEFGIARDGYEIFTDTLSFYALHWYSDKNELSVLIARLAEIFENPNVQERLSEYDANFIGVKFDFVEGLIERSLVPADTEENYLGTIMFVFFRLYALGVYFEYVTEEKTIKHYNKYVCEVLPDGVVKDVIDIFGSLNLSYAPI